MGPNLTDRGKRGVKRHLVFDRQGLPLSAGRTGAERPDATVFAAVVGSTPPVRGSRGRPCQRSEKVHADKSYDARHYRRYLHRRETKVSIACEDIEDKLRLGRWRWMVERSYTWLNHYRRLTIRYERREELHRALLVLTCAMICLNALRRQATGLCNE